MKRDSRQATPALPLTPPDHRPVHGRTAWAGRLPAAITALDVAALTLAVLALVVFLSGGWRVRVFGVLVSMRSWDRPLAWALLAVALRHVLVPRPSVLDHIREMLRAARTATAGSAWPHAFAVALGPVTASRVVVYGIGLFALAAIGLPPAAGFAGDNRFLDMLLRWDAGWYTAIAENGYSWNGDPRAENPVVFFPAYPMLIRAGAWATGAHPAYVGFVISIVAFTWAMAYVYRMAREQFALPAPHLALSLMVWYPFALFFSSVYTESLFLLALAGSFYHARERQRLPAAAWALVVSLAKPNGFFVALPLTVMFALRAWKVSGWQLWRMDGPTLRGLAADAAVVAAPLLGIASYSYYLWGLTGDPLAWLHGQQAWGRVFQGPLALLDVARHRLSAGPVQAIAEAPVVALNAIAATFAVVAIVPIFFRLGAPYALIVALQTIPPLLAGGTTSMGRFTSCMFPIFIWLAGAIPASSRTTWCAVFAAGQALAAVLFFTWRPLF